MAGPGAGAGPYEKDVGHEQMHCSHQTTYLKGGFPNKLVFLFWFSKGH